MEIFCLLSLPPTDIGQCLPNNYFLFLSHKLNASESPLSCLFLPVIPPHSIGQPIFFGSHCCLYRNMQMFALRRFHLSFLPISAQSTFLSRRVFLVVEIEVNDLATGDQRGSMV